MISGLGPVSFNRGKRSAPLPGPLQGCFPRKKLTSLGAEINCQVSRIAANAAEETLLLGLYLDHDRGNRRRGALATQLTACRRAGTAALGRERTRTPSSTRGACETRPDLLRLCRRWGLLVRRFGRCFPRGSGPDGGWIQFFGPAALVAFVFNGGRRPLTRPIV